MRPEWAPSARCQPSGNGGECLNTINTTISVLRIFIFYLTACQRMHANERMPNYSYSGSNLVANVAYDIFTNNDCGSTPLYEIMVWVGALGGAGPISSTGSTIASVNINGVTWDLYKGSHSQMTVFSFVAQSKNERSFSGDLKDFFDYLVDKQGYPSSQCLYSIGAGTEPFTGSNAVFDTSSYSVSLLTGSGGGSGGSTTTSSGTTPTNGPSCASMYGQCGGQGWNGPTCCSSGTCTKANDWYSQCI